jgi:glyoxylase-like metal-dependent hydrolase (beta-lactamase superfamily II)
MPDFTEVAERVWVARYPWFDVNITLVGSERGLLMVDTHGSAGAAREVVDDVRRLGAGEVVGVVNTHWHFDHTFGNHTVREAWPGIPIHAHEEAATALAEWGESVKQRYADDPDDPHSDDVVGTTLVMPDHTFSSAVALDLGDRFVELVHSGRGHTSGDLVVRLPDADVVLAGDLVEESGPPAYGVDCHPLDWPGTLDVVLTLLTPGSVVVPGHGARVDRDFVEQQRQDVAIAAQTIRDLAAAGVPADRALAEGEWPFPREGLEHAVRRGYAALPPGGRSLPLA